MRPWDEEQRQPIAAEAPPSRARLRRPRLLGWAALVGVMVLLVLWLVAPTLRYGANLSPPGPAAWDKAQTRTAATPLPRHPAPKTLPVDPNLTDAAPTDNADQAIAPPAAAEPGAAPTAVDQATPGPDADDAAGGNDEGASPR